MLGCYNHNPPFLVVTVLYLFNLNSFFRYIHRSLTRWMYLSHSLLLLGLAVTESISLIVETGHSITRVGFNHFTCGLELDVQRFWNQCVIDLTTLRPAGTSPCVPNTPLARSTCERNETLAFSHVD
jgi:hypothetical protein